MKTIEGVEISLKEKGFEVKKCEDQIVWENLNVSQEYISYFQSWDWGEVQKKLEHKMLRIGIYKNLQLLGIAQIFEIRARRGHYLHIRQGPVFSEWKNDVVLTLFRAIEHVGKDVGASYIRISPLVRSQGKEHALLQKLGFNSAPIHNVDAENRWILSLDPSEEELLKNMRKTTRYLIRKGQNMNINIVRSQNVSDIEKFFQVFKETLKLKKFIPPAGIREEFELYTSKGKAFMYFAYLGKKLESAAIITDYGKETIYRHGATTLEGRNTPSSYLIQWTALTDAKKRGQRLYNFWGIAGDDRPENPWYGLSQFKKGFGGHQEDFLHAMDKKLSLRYHFSYAIDVVTTFKKGYRLKSN